jgi:phage protein D
MQQVEYRMFFDGRPATRDQLDGVDTVTVEQAMDAAWQARIEIPICADDRGNWSGQDADYFRDFARIRLEVRVGDGEFVPLIDGPSVGRDSRMDAQPGQSSIVLVVHDDSVFLNREDREERFENMTDSEIARQIFNQCEQIAETRIDDVPAAPGSRPPEVAHRGTHMRLLRELAERNEMHAYVLPGSEPGASIGVFEESPTAPADLPVLVLPGRERNLESFDFRSNEQRVAEVVASTMSLCERRINTRRSISENIDRLGEEAPSEDVQPPATRRLPPGSGEAVDLDHRVNAEARRLSYAYEASGTVRAGCYAGVLQPYLVVGVCGINARNSGNYLITRVTHRLTRSDYTQSFALKRNARSSGSGASIPGGIF